VPGLKSGCAGRAVATRKSRPNAQCH
jgi:hypothetical protein